MSACELGRGHADQGFFRLALSRHYGLVDHDRAADELGVAAGLLKLVEKVHRVSAAETEIDRIHVIGQLWNERAEVFRSAGHPQPLGDLTAKRAIIQRQPEHLRVSERIVLRQRRDLLVVTRHCKCIDRGPCASEAIDIERKKFGAGST